MLRRFLIALPEEREPRSLGAPGDLLFLSREFPSVAISLEEGVIEEPEATIYASEWGASPFTPEVFDARLAKTGEIQSFCLRLVLDAPGGWPGNATEVLTRYQRFMERRNEASTGPLFAKVLERHRELHALEKPLVRADYDHALDTWQWMLRLSPEASFPLQVAALFHDIERLVSEADVRVEQHAADYQAFKNAHAKSGAAFARGLLSYLGVPGEDLARVQALIEEHEQPRGDPESGPQREPHSVAGEGVSGPSAALPLLDVGTATPRRGALRAGPNPRLPARSETLSEARALLNDADALSFFSLNSPGFLRYYGLAHTRRKVLYSLRRLRPESLPRLSQIRHPDAIGEILSEALFGFERKQSLS